MAALSGQADARNSFGVVGTATTDLPQNSAGITGIAGDPDSVQSWSDRVDAFGQLVGGVAVSGIVPLLQGSTIFHTSFGFLAGSDPVFNQHAGVYGESDQLGVIGMATAAGTTGVFGGNKTGSGFGVRGETTSGVGVQGQSFGSGAAARFIGNVDCEGNLAVNNQAPIGMNVNVTGSGLVGIQGMGPQTGVRAQATGASGIGLEGAGISAGVKGQAAGEGPGHVGVLGRAIIVPNPADPVVTGALTSEVNALASGGRGVLGVGSNVGVQGIATTGNGLDGLSMTGVGVSGGTSGTGPNAAGIVGVSRAGGGSFAGKFTGNVDVAGNLSKSGGGFKIDHPLSPAEMYLNHSFVESPDRKNVYDGVAVLNPHGEATVELPEWFEALNTSFRYQLTCIGEFAPVHIGRKLRGNRFIIAGGRDGMEVSWQVTGVRSDAWAKANPLAVEEIKHETERGTYRHPESCEHGRATIEETDLAVA
ncbi:hypothetical protein [Tunturiibacter lichenicola]|uniref:hypothetical protein n=1 Tax=Tunturiibacter lichenicola TaxID=2051959 RepID=UPI003D9B7EFC